jgi:hypothetical protein
MEYTEVLYIQSVTDLQTRYTRLGQIITALETQMLLAATDTNIEEYSLDDGQVKIKTLYRSPDSIAKAINAFEVLQQKTFNKLNGRAMVCRPWKGLN